MPIPGGEEAGPRQAGAEPVRPSPQRRPFVGGGRTPPAFNPGDLVAGRYRVTRLVGRGGMGDVFEVEDLELGVRVALKTIRAEGDPEDRKETVERFRREIQLARRISHPNVCRIFDIGHHVQATHEGAEGTADDITFLTMELIDGATLADRLRRDGRVPPDEALRIVSQMASALAAAHDAGVIHRDFKSANIMLERPRDGSQMSRAVVTDFGLARSAATGERAAATLTGTGLVVGTAAYMAPEQVAGQQVTTAADIYALGLVMYEMVTGQLPFIGSSPLSTAVKRLHEAPVPPRVLVPDLPAPWETVILRCLERDPADRFSNAREVMAALGGEKVVAGRKDLLRRKKWNRAGVAAGLIAALFAAALIYRAERMSEANRRATARSAASAARRSVAVLGFKNLSGRSESAWLSTALSEMLATELAVGDRIRTIPGENVARMKVELSLNDAETLAAETLARIRANLGADFVVSGSYVDLGQSAGGQMRLDIRLQDAATGETIAAIPSVGATDRLFDLVSQAGGALRGKLGAGELSAEEVNGVRAAMPASSDAARYYAEGIQRLRMFDALAARGLLEKSIASEPGYPLAHSALAEALSGLGYGTAAAEEAKKAFDLSAKLSREDRLAVEARYSAANDKWEKSIEIYRTLFNFFPDNLEYGLKLAEAQVRGQKGSDSLATVDALRTLPAPARDDPRIDLAESSAARSLADFQRQLSSAQNAARKARDRGARLVLARARLSEGVACRNLGNLNAAAAANEEAKKIYEGAGDRSGVAWALNNLATLRSDQGDQAAAEKMFEEVLTTYRAVGDKSGVALALGNVATVLLSRGELAEARRMLEQSVQTYDEIGEKTGAAWALNQIGVIFKNQGDLTRSKETYQQSLTLYREIGDKSGIAQELTNMANVVRAQGDLPGATKMLVEAESLYREIGESASIGLVQVNLADVSSSQGDLLQAKTLYAQSLKLYREIADKSYSAYGLSGMGEVLLAGGDLAGARKMHEDALSIREELGEKGTVAESQTALAAIEIEEGRFSEAQSHALAAAEEFRAEQIRDSEAMAEAVRARALLAMGKTGDARQAMSRAVDLIRQSQDLSMRLVVKIAEARILAASDRPGDSVKSLQSSIASATSAGFVAIRLSATLELGEAELRAGRQVEGRRQLLELEKEARSRGYLLIARKSGEALAGERRP